MFGALDLMNQEKHVVGTVKLTLLAVGVVWVFFLVFDHRIFSFEVLEAFWVGTLDLHLRSWQEW